MDLNSKIYVAGHKGLVGSALVRTLTDRGFDNIVVRNSSQLDLRNQAQTQAFFNDERPDYVFLAAARVGGILANSTYQAEFIYDNVMIAANVIHSAYQFGVKKLLNLGSSCIYPKFAKQPLKEEYLLTDSLEPTNEPYAIAKICAIKLCSYYNAQYNTDFISVMPTNLYGPGDNYHLKNSHVLPALIRKFHLAGLLMQADFDQIRNNILVWEKNEAALSWDKDQVEQYLAENLIYADAVGVWGTGSPLREFLYVDDLAECCLYLMDNYKASYIGEFVNIGTGKDIPIAELALLIKEILNYPGQIRFHKEMPDGTPRKLLNIKKIKRLGWEPRYDLRRGITMAYQSYLSGC